MSENFTFEHGQLDHILSELASLTLHVKELKDNNHIEEEIFERIVTIYEELHAAIMKSRLDREKIGEQYEH